jgi:hypothetical protein
VHGTGIKKPAVTRVCGLRWIPLDTYLVGDAGIEPTTSPV